MATEIKLCDAARADVESLLHLALLHRMAGWRDISEIEQIFGSELVPGPETAALTANLDAAIDELASRTKAGEICRLTLADLVAELEKPAELDATAARYERALRAIAGCKLAGVDFGDYVQALCDDVLDGGEEAECPECGTAWHEGPCVSDGAEDGVTA